MSEIEHSSMNFFDHIKELRQKLLYVIIFFIDPTFFNPLKIEDPINPHPIIEI